MGALRAPRPEEDIGGYARLTTKIVRDWRKRPMWVRRSRLVAREFRTWAPWTEELFAPSSSLGAVHQLISIAMAKGLEVTTIDVKDAYLNVPQKAPVVITVDRSLVEDGGVGEAPFILERLLPGQRVAAAEWFQYVKEMLLEADLENFEKEPTLFRGTGLDDDTNLILHADDGILASTQKAREKVLGVLKRKVEVKVSDPFGPGCELEFLKRRYLWCSEGATMMSGTKHLEGLLNALGHDIKERDAPADTSFVEEDKGDELTDSKRKLYQECVGRLLYLSHTRADIQYSVSVLAGKMAKPTTTSMRWLVRVAGYLKRVPDLGFLIKPLVPDANLEYSGQGKLVAGSTVVLESVSDADWGGCKRTRRSKSSAHFYLAGGLIASHVRTQKSIALSSGESEFVAMVSGATELIFLKDCLGFMLKNKMTIEAKVRSDSAAAQGMAQRLGTGRVRHLACGMMWLQASVKSKMLKIGSISGSTNPADLGTKVLAGPKVRQLLYYAGARLEDGTAYGQLEAEEAAQRTRINQIVTNGVKKPSLKHVLPVLLVLSQIVGSDGASFEGLGLGVAMAGLEDTVAEVSYLASAVLLRTSILLVFPCGLAYVIWKLLGIFFRSGKGSTKEMAVQASMRSRAEQAWADEYTDKVNYLNQILAEERAEKEQMENALKRLREEARARRTSQPQTPTRLVIAMSRGTVFHLPGCHCLRSSSNTKSFGPCQYCFPGATG